MNCRQPGRQISPHALSFHISILWQELNLQNETAPPTKDGSCMCDTQFYSWVPFSKICIRVLRDTVSPCENYQPVTIFWPCPEVVIKSDKHCSCKSLSRCIQLQIPISLHLAASPCPAAYICKSLPASFSCKSLSCGQFFGCPKIFLELQLCFKV